MFKKIKALLQRKAAVVMTAAIALIAALPTAVGAAPIDFSTTTGLTVSTTDVVATGWSFANMFGSWTMLVLGIIVAPVVIGFVIWLMRKLPKFGGGSKA